MPLNRKIYCTMIVAALLSACVSAGFTPIGSSGSNVRFTPIGSSGSNAPGPLPSSSPVYIYSSEKEVAASFRVIGNISYRNPGIQQTFLFPDAVPDLKEQARKVGANGIIIDELVVSEAAAVGGVVGTLRSPFRVEARAIFVE
jgi:hypothetical protein